MKSLKMRENWLNVWKIVKNVTNSPKNQPKIFSLLLAKKTKKTVKTTNTHFSQTREPLVRPRSKNYLIFKWFNTNCGYSTNSMFLIFSEENACLWEDIFLLKNCIFRIHSLFLFFSSAHCKFIILMFVSIYYPLLYVCCKGILKVLNSACMFITDFIRKGA